MTCLNPCSPQSLAEAISIHQYLDSVQKHRAEIREAGDFLIANLHLFPFLTAYEVHILQTHFVNYLKNHDLPKLWGREELTKWGYDPSLPTPRDFFAQNYKVNFRGTALDASSENDRYQESQKVIDSMNQSEYRFNLSWFLQQKLSDTETQMLFKQFEHLLDVLVTKLSKDRQQELGMTPYQLYDVARWLTSHRQRPSQLRAFYISIFWKIVKFEKNYVKYIQKRKWTADPGSIAHHRCIYLIRGASSTSASAPVSTPH